MELLIIVVYLLIRNRNQNHNQSHKAKITLTLESHREKILLCMPINTAVQRTNALRLIGKLTYQPIYYNDIYQKIKNRYKFFN